MGTSLLRRVLNLRKEVIYGNQERNMEIHLADLSGYHQRHPNEFGSNKLFDVRENE